MAPWRGTSSGTSAGRCGTGSKGFSGADLGERRDPLGGFVKAGNQAEFLAARLQEGSPGGYSDLLQRLQAIGNQSGADDIDSFDFFFCQRHKGWLGIRLEPLRRAEARLEGHCNLVFRED